MNSTASATRTSRRTRRGPPLHGKKVRRASRDSDGGDAFVRDFRSGVTAVRDDYAESSGEVFVWTVTSNDAISELARDEVHADEMSELVFDLEEDDTVDPAAGDGRPARPINAR
jgi:hypothetical protein